MILTKELYEFIESECDKFKEQTWEENNVDVNDVLYSYLFSTKEEFHVLIDWDEGENSDPFWNHELNEHSVIVFLKRMCLIIDNKLKKI